MRRPTSCRGTLDALRSWNTLCAADEHRDVLGVDACRVENGHEVLVVDATGADVAVE